MSDYVGESVRRWPDPLVGPFALRVSVGLIDGALSIVGLELFGDRVGSSLPLAPKDDGMDLSEFLFPNVALGDTPHRIDAQTLRELAPGRLLEEYKQSNSEELDNFLQRFGTAAKASDIGSFLLNMVERTATNRSRTPVYGRLHWQAVAEVYRDALERGEAPTLAVAAKFVVSKSAAAKWVAKCRKLELLPATTQGRSIVRGDSK
jgi:hypothetical protein